MAVPDLDPEERRAAREKALRNRRLRAELKDMLETGEVSVGEVLGRADESDALARMRVSDLIGAVPGYGDVRTRRLMEELEIADSRRLGGLGPRQRERLLAHFGNT